MGLDMYAFSVKAEDAIGDFEIRRDSEGSVDSTEIAYWRKFNALHGWMEDLYRAKGGTKDSFNCVPVRLTVEDLTKLTDDVLKKNLKPREGFFFGEQKIYPEDIEEVYAFVGKALAEIRNGNAVYYDSWW